MREPQISDAEADEVFAGRRPEGRDDLARVADAMAWLRIQSHTADPPQIGPDLHERLTVRLADGARRTRGGARASVLSLAAAATILLGVLVSGSQGMLPAPVQTIVADAGDAVGVTFPRPPADPDVVSGPGGAEWSTPNPDGGSRGTGDGESAADGKAPGGTSGDHLTADEGSGLDGESAARWCEGWPSEDWRPGDWEGGDSRRDERERGDWDRDEHDGRAGSAWRADRSSDEPAGFDRGVDPKQQGRDINWAGRSRGGDGPAGGDARDGHSWPGEWCERVGPAGH